MLAALEPSPADPFHALMLRERAIALRPLLDLATRTAAAALRISNSCKSLLGLDDMAMADSLGFDGAHAAAGPPSHQPLPAPHGRPSTFTDPAHQPRFGSGGSCHDQHPPVACSTPFTGEGQLHPSSRAAPRDQFLLLGCGTPAHDHFLLGGGAVPRDHFPLSRGGAPRDQFLLGRGTPARDHFLLGGGAIARDQFLLGGGSFALNQSLLDGASDADLRYLGSSRGSRPTPSLPSAFPCDRSRTGAAGRPHEPYPPARPPSVTASECTSFDMNAFIPPDPANGPRPLPNSLLGPKRCLDLDQPPPPRCSCGSPESLRSLLRDLVRSPHPHPPGADQQRYHPSIPQPPYGLGGASFPEASGAAHLAPSYDDFDYPLAPSPYPLLHSTRLKLHPDPFYDPPSYPPPQAYHQPDPQPQSASWPISDYNTSPLTDPSGHQSSPSDFCPSQMLGWAPSQTCSPQLQAHPSWAFPSTPGPSCDCLLPC